MSTQDANKLVIVISHNEHDDRTVAAFTTAKTALSMGMHVAIYLLADGVEMSRELGCDFADDTYPETPLLDLITSYFQQGGILWYSTSCFRKRGFQKTETFEKAIAADARPMLEWIKAGATVLSV